MQFFWKHLHNNKGDENVSKLIWIVIAFVIGALLLSTMSVAFRTDGTGTISGWLNSTLENWFGEADGRDGSVGGGAGGSGGGGNTGGNEGGGNEAFAITNIAMKYNPNVTPPQLTTDSSVGGAGGDYSDTFKLVDINKIYTVASYASTNGTTNSADLFNMNVSNNDEDESGKILSQSELQSIDSDLGELFAEDTYIIYVNSGLDIYIGVDKTGNIICPLPMDPSEGNYVVINIYETELTPDPDPNEPSEPENSNIVLAWDDSVQAYTTSATGSTTDYSPMMATSTMIPNTAYSVSLLPATESDGSDASGVSLMSMRATSKLSPEYNSSSILITEDEEVVSVDNYGNIIVNGVEQSSDFAVLSMERSASVANIATETESHNGIIPVGGIYFVGATATNLSGPGAGFTEKYETGDQFPTPQTGDVYVYGDYVYKYNYHYEDWVYNRLVANDSDNSNDYKDITGWGVAARVRTYDPDINSGYVPEYNSPINTRTYEPALTAIAGEDVTVMSYCYSNCLFSVNLPTSLPARVVVMDYAFDNCKIMTSIPSIPSTVKTLRGTFRGCALMSSAPVLPNSLSGPSCLEATFAGSGITTMPIIPESVTTLPDTFNSCSKLVTVSKIPDKVDCMQYTFEYCTSLTHMPELPSKLVFAPNTFAGCTNLITTTPIPSGVTHAANMFDGCTKISSITIESEKVDTAYGFVDNTSQNITIKVPANSTTYTTIYNSCAHLSNVTIQTF